MDQVYVIRHKVLVEGKSQREVSREMGIGRNTIKKYLNESEPKFQTKSKRRCYVLEKAKKRIDEIWDEWSSRTTRKQRITGDRIYQQLISEDIKISISTVRNYLRRKKESKSETFIPLVHYCGDEAQVDFFEVTVSIGNERVKCWMFLMRLMWSGKDFVFLYEHADQVSFLDGHVRAFKFFGGVPHRIIYDNLKPAVKKIFYSHRELSLRFKALTSHYLFEPCFARVGEGHDKGGVESRGKGIRLQHLVPIPSGKTLEDINNNLQQRLAEQARLKKDRGGLTIEDKFSKEKEKLKPLPKTSFEPREVLPLRLSAQSLVRIKGGIYSLPTHWKSLDVTAYLGPKDIRFICRDEVLIRKRIAPFKKNIHYKDYLKELSRKPQATRQVAPELIQELGKPFSTLWKILQDCHGGKEAGRIFSRVLTAILKHGEEAVSKALKESIEHGQNHLLALKTISSQNLCSKIDVPESLQQFVVESSSLEHYCKLQQDTEVTE